MLVFIKDGKIKGKIKDGVYLLEILEGKIILSPIKWEESSELRMDLSLEDIEYMIRKGALA
ncbi:hypothetical protein [Candidatus Korarchaeum cryptofilum]|uniref:hypothetical protein n=1 Tax=Candidatus Korarchaeum cryptofilum TaxID=498846 RepID=UPI0006969CA7|nr:hypothetical protein [Candidatus Korarchaeum cryptofilum]